MENTDIAYAAGILDGEGYVGIIRRSSGKGGYQRGSYTVQVCIGMTHEPTIRWLADTFGFNFYVKQPAQSHHSVSYLAFLHQRRAESFLRLVQPYVRTKREQVALALEYLSGYTTWMDSGSARLTDEEITRRDTVYHRLRDLNGRKRGSQPQ